MMVGLRKRTMPLQPRIETIQQESTSNRKVPVVIKWKDQKIVRNQSFFSTIDEIINWSETLDVTKIGLIGDPHSGKSTLAETIAHCIHTRSKKIPYTVRIFGKEDLLNFEQTIKNLQPANYVLIFDDVSFMGASANKKQIEMVKQASTEIRHLPGGRDVKIVGIMNYHYTLGLDKYLRQADFRYFLTVGSSEKENMEAIGGSKYNKLIDNFINMRRHAIAKKYWAVPITPKEFLTHKYRQPFIPVLFFNESSMRLIVSPTRQWLDPICATCSEAKGDILQSGVSIEQFNKESEEKFGKGNWLAAIKLHLYTNGMTVYGKHVVQALRYYERARATKIITSEQQAAHYGLEITKTKLRKKMDGVLESDSMKNNSVVA